MFYGNKASSLRLQSTCVAFENMPPRGSHAVGCVKGDTGGGGEINKE